MTTLVADLHDAMCEKVAMSRACWLAVEHCVWPRDVGVECGGRVRSMWTEQQLRMDPVTSAHHLHVTPQPINGPCGVIAAFQAHVFRHLMQSTKETKPEDERGWRLSPDIYRRALATMLWQAATEPSVFGRDDSEETKSTTEATEPTEPTELTEAMKTTENMKMTLRFIDLVRANRRFQPRAPSYMTLVNEITTEQEAMDAIERTKCDPSTWSAAALVFSLVLTRGCDVVVRELQGGVVDGSNVLPLDSLISKEDEDGGSVAGFCEHALISLCLWGRVSDTYRVVPSRTTSLPRVGLMTLPEDGGDGGSDEIDRAALAWMTRPEFPVWAALWGGHVKVMLRCVSGEEEQGAEKEFICYLTDGLHLDRAITSMRLRCGGGGGGGGGGCGGGGDDALSSKSSSSSSSLVSLVVEIIGQRMVSSSDEAKKDPVRLLQVVCRCKESDESDKSEEEERVRGHDVGQRWYCRNCYLSLPRVYAYNAADNTTCKVCEKRREVCGSSHWITEDEVPALILQAFDVSRAPAELKLARTVWPNVMLVKNGLQYSGIGDDKK